jgi:hypothetical protein
VDDELMNSKVALEWGRHHDQTELGVDGDVEAFQKKVEVKLRS